MSADFYDLFNKTPPPQDSPGTVALIDPARASKYARSALENECRSVATAVEGTRNDTLNRAAFSIGQLVAAGHLERGDAWTALETSARTAGLEEAEIAPTLTSGLGAGNQLPRVVPDLPAVPTPTILPGVAEAAVEGVVTSDDLAATWAPVDLTAVLAGTYEPELPLLMPRSDDACLLYPGRIHSFHGESESGKSLVAQIEATRLVTLGAPVLFVDFESDHSAVIARLLDLGATAAQIGRWFTYVRPEVDPRRFPHERDAVAALLGNSYTLAVIDGVTEALGVFGHSTKDNDDITAFMRLLPRTVARQTGAAVILVDHVTKDSESRGRFAIGGQAKMASLDGAAYVVEVVEALGRGRRGMVTLRVAKDRPGGVRAHAGEFRKTDRTQEAARVVIDSDPAGRIQASVLAPLQDGDSSEFRPTHIMERVSEFIEISDVPLSTRTIEDGVDGRAETVRRALALLVRDHYVKLEIGPRNARLHTSIQPYREVSDPTSTKHVTTLTERPRPTSSDLVPDEVTVTSSQPLRSRAGRDEVSPSRTTSPRPDEQDEDNPTLESQP